MRVYVWAVCVCVCLVIAMATGSSQQQQQQQRQQQQRQPARVTVIKDFEYLIMKMSEANFFLLPAKERERRQWQERGYNLRQDSYAVRASGRMWLESLAGVCFRSLYARILLRLTTTAAATGATTWRTNCVCDVPGSQTGAAEMRWESSSSSSRSSGAAGGIWKIPFSCHSIEFPFKLLFFLGQASLFFCDWRGASAVCLSI